MGIVKRYSIPSSQINICFIFFEGVKLLKKTFF